MRSVGSTAVVSPRRDARPGASGRIAVVSAIEPAADPARLAEAFRQVVERSLAVGAGDEVCIVCDPDRLEIAQGLHDAVVRAGGVPAITVLSPDPGRGSEPPAFVAAAMQTADVLLGPCLPSLSHTTARKEATAAGVRAATLPGATAAMLARLMTADLELVRRRSLAVAELLGTATAARLTCPAGTDLTLDLTGRPGISDDGDLRSPGAFGNLPCGEGFVSPCGGSGRIAASVLPTSGVVDEPVLLDVVDGRLAGASGGPAGAADAFLAALDAHGPVARTIAELGIGTNENALVTGNILEDEKILGTAHVAFGASAGIGGDVTVPVHLDVVIVRPTVTVDGVTVVDDSAFALGA